MDMSLVNAASNASPQSANAGAAVAVLKKAMDMQAQTATTLLQALPAPQSYNNPPGLGGNVDVKV
ncbi:Putative motility protein [Formivibrio citricus]|uniref:Motility protein n=1 Tax=Formivibrio citricus TaxID=83765 RepID=A0A1I5BB30_9NEIS|nr:YjfB family protein [Formivibrio citricus]SFN71850.1 Putative motility protein [Formivibrio citricus]